MDENGLEEYQSIPQEERIVQVATRRGTGRREETVVLPSNTWLITFADLCTLILTFFVLLFSMSSLNKDAFRRTFQGSGGVGIVADAPGADPAGNARETAIREITGKLEKLDATGDSNLEIISGENVLKRDAVGLLGSGNAVWVRRLPGKDSFSLTFGDQLFFESGKASLDTRVYPVLEVVAGFLAAGTFECFVEGHTDAIPINSPIYANNEELSLARSLAVIYALSERFKVNPRLLASGAYGSSRPITGERTPEALAMNRRVEMVFHRVEQHNEL